MRRKRTNNRNRGKRRSPRADMPLACASTRCSPPAASPQTIELVSNVVRATNARGFHARHQGSVWPMATARKRSHRNWISRAHDFRTRGPGQPDRARTLLSWSRYYHRANLSSSTAPATFPRSSFPIPSTRCCATSLADSTPRRLRHGALRGWGVPQLPEHPFAQPFRAGAAGRN